jgi:NADPH:quinone reductase-like Zn-dependent oxidoreductase
VFGASVNPADVFLMRGVPRMVRLERGLLRPRSPLLGKDVAGVVAAVGPGVTGFEAGDEVYGEVGGSYAELACAPEALLARKPRNLSFEEAAAVPLAGITALQGLRDKGRVQAGQRVLVNGAAGGVGTFAVQIAKAMGAEVTGVCGTDCAALVRSLGADHVVDYTREDFSACEGHYDLIFDLVGSRPLRACVRALQPKGLYLAAMGKVGWLLKAALVGLVSRRVAVLTTAPNRSDLDELRELVERGAVTPVIHRRFALHQVPDALRLQEAGHARGKTVISMAPGPSS